MGWFGRERHTNVVDITISILHLRKLKLKEVVTCQSSLSREVQKLGIQSLYSLFTVSAQAGCHSRPNESDSPSGGTWECVSKSSTGPILTKGC